MFPGGAEMNTQTKSKTTCGYDIGDGLLCNRRLINSQTRFCEYHLTSEDTWTPIPSDLEIDSPFRAFIVKSVKCHKPFIDLLKEIEYSLRSKISGQSELNYQAMLNDVIKAIANAEDA